MKTLCMIGLALAMTTAVAADEGRPAPTFTTPESSLALIHYRCSGFDPGSSYLDADCRAILDDVGYELRSYPGAIAYLAGHTDDHDTDALNSLTAITRAGLARRYLTSLHGVDPDQIVVETPGSAEPIADNLTAAGRARNRRVEILIAIPVPWWELAPLAMLRGRE